MSKFVDLTGQRFGRLTVIERSDIIKRSGKRETAFLCKCGCGKECVVMAYNLKNGHTQSCSCLSLKKRVAARTTHHETGTRLYQIWFHMKRRTTNVNDREYSYYGGRGITICDEWLSYEPFRDWALQNGYSAELSIDRIDNNKGYCPENCRWTTQKVQSNNTRKNRIIECDGTSHTLAEWGDITGINATTIAYRIKKGMTVRDALFTPVRRSKNAT